MAYKTKRKYTKKARTTAVAQLEKKVNMLASATEVEFHDVDFTDDPMSYDANSSRALAAVPAGATYSSATNRDGRQITPKSLHIKGMVSIPPSTGNQLEPVVRVMVVQSKARFIPNTASTTLEHVLEAQNTAMVVHSPFLRSHRAHFTVLKDVTMHMGYRNNTIGSSGGNNVRLFDWKLYPKRPVKWASSTGTVTENGQIYLLTWSNQLNGADSANITYYSRLTYLD